MKNEMIENLEKVNKKIDLAVKKIEVQEKTLKWIDERASEGIALFNSHNLNIGQAVTILQDIHATVFELGLKK